MAMGMISTTGQALDPIKSMPFRMLLASSGSSNLADGIYKVLLPLAVLAVSTSPFHLAVATTFLACGWPVFGMLGGILADRLDRRRISIASNCLRAAALLLLAMALAGGSTALWPIYLSAIVFGCCEALNDTAIPGMVTRLIGPDHRPAANARLSVVRSIADEFAGPGLGAMLALYSIAMGFGISAALCFLAVGSLATVPGKFQADRAIGGRRAGIVATGLRDLREGIVFVWRHGLLRRLALLVMLLAGTWGLWLALIPYYLATAIAPDAVEASLGLLMMLFAAGGLVGGIITPWLTARFGLHRLVLADLIGTFFLLIAPALSNSLAIIAAATFASGIGGAIWGVTVSTLRQNVAPDAFIGRATGAFRVIGYSTMPVLALFGGVLAEFLPTQIVFGLAAALPALGLVYSVRWLDADMVRAAHDRTDPD